MRKTSTKKIVKRILEINQELERMKVLYRELDMLTDKLLQADFKEGHGAKVIDNFNSKNTAFKTTAIRRYDIVPHADFFKVRKSR